MTQIDLGPLNEDCIALRDGLACKCEEDGQPVLALTLRQIASRYQRLLNKLFAEQANDAAEKRVAELEAALAAHQWRPVSEEPASGKYFVRTRDGTITTDMFLFGDWLVLSGMVTHYVPMPDAPQGPTQ